MGSRFCSRTFSMCGHSHVWMDLHFLFSFALTDSGIILLELLVYVPTSVWGLVELLTDVNSCTTSCGRTTTMAADGYFCGE